MTNTQVAMELLQHLIMKDGADQSHAFVFAKFGSAMASYYTSTFLSSVKVKTINLLDNQFLVLFAKTPDSSKEEKENILPFL